MRAVFPIDEVKTSRIMKSANAAPVAADLSDALTTLPARGWGMIHGQADRVANALVGHDGKARMPLAMDILAHCCRR
jgi:hypothetical protein